MAKVNIKFRLVGIVCAIVLVLLGLVTLALSNLAAHTARETINDRFEWATQRITDRVALAADKYAETLINGRSLIYNSEEVTFEEWVGFYKSQDVFNRLQGLSSISYIELVPEGELDAFIRARQAQKEFGPDYNVTRGETGGEYALGKLVVSKAPMKLSGFNVYSTPVRKKVYEQALKTGQPVASPQIKLNSGFLGMFIVQVLESNGRTGFVNTALHSEEFFNDVLLPDHLEVAAVQIRDVTPGENETVMYECPHWSNSNDDMTLSDRISFGGRTWEIVYHAQDFYANNGFVKVAPLLVMGTGLFFITILFGGIYILTRRLKQDESINISV